MRFLTLSSICSSLCSRLRPFPITVQIRSVHHHRELEQPGGFERFAGWKRSNPAKANRNTHVNERKYKKLRGAKRLLLELDVDYDERRQTEMMRPDDMRMYMLRKGKPNAFKNVSAMDWNEHQTTLNTFGQTMDAYIPPENSWLSRGAKEIVGDLKEKAIRAYHGTFYGIRRIRKKEGFQQFNVKHFTKIAEEVYINAYNALAIRDKQKLHQLITEAAFAKLWPDVEKGTLCWKLVEFNEPSKVVSVRCVDNPAKSGNDVAQIIVRMHSTQILALYDKDGHLLLGSEKEPRDCLEYVVFENHVASIDGLWRLHDRVYPKWLKPKQASTREGLIEEADREKLPERPVKLHVGMGDKMKEFRERSGGN